MSEDWREELIEKMAKAAWESDGVLNWEGELGRKIYLLEARAALAVAEPVIREQADIALRAELAAVTERMSKLDFERTAAELERDALREENARLREALKPFAEAAEELDESDKDNWDIWEHWVAMNIEIGHLRAAAAAIREGGKDG